MRTRSLVGRVVALQQLVVLAAFVAFALSSLLLTRQVLRAEDHAALVETATRMAHGYDDELGELSDPARAATELLGEGVPAGMRIEILDAAGRPLASTAARTLHPATGQPAGGATPTPGRSADIVTTRSKSGATVRVTRTDTRLERVLAVLAWALALSAIPLLLAAFLFGRLVVRRAMAPLSAMARRAEELRVAGGAGTLGTPAGLEEMDRLHASFSRLLERLGDALRAERRFTADASHELRTPLTALSGELELAGARAGADPDLAAGLQRAAGQVRAMRELVDALLLLRRSDQGGGRESMEWVNLADVVREGVGEQLARFPGRTPDVGVVAPDEVLVRGHAALLAAGVRNLLDNALKFTLPSQRVRVEVTREPHAGRIVVEDAGPGIPEDERERVFDSFYRGAEARARPSGFGLGLPILRRVARVHGGDVNVGASPLGGARFELWVPLAVDGSAPVEADPGPVTPAAVRQAS